VRSARVISLVGALAALPTLLPGVTAVAAGADEPVIASARLEVHALPDCTTREELAARVAARSRRIQFADDAPGPTLRAVIAPAPRGGAVGELQIAEPNGKTSTRRISAPSCAEATDAIALIIALTLDPTSAATARPPAAPPSAAPATAPARASAEAPPASAAPAPREGEAPGRLPAAPAPAPTPARRLAPAPVTPAAPPPTVEESPVVVASPELPVATTTRFGGGLTGDALTGAAPDPLLGVGLYLLAALDRDALWSPAAIVRGTHAWSNGLAETGGTASFTLDALALDACALRVHAGSFEARACATGLYGRLAASGSETYAPAAASRPYAVAGGALVMSVAAGRLLELSARLGGGASLVRDSFAFSPNVFHRTAAATFSGSLGVGVRFP
jgi:hypothetical protein